MPHLVDPGVVLILAPRGRDAPVIEHVLEPLGVRTRACASLQELTDHLGDDASVAILTEESLGDEASHALCDWIDGQPPWSDFPFVVLATRRAGRRSIKAAELLLRLGNAVLLERPLSADTLISAANSAMRSRRRQYEARSQVQRLEAIGLENRRLYEAEAQARAEAEAANTAKDEFLAILSHELRTPLSAILGWTYVLQQRRSDFGDMARGVDTIQRNAKSQARLIEDLLDMSKIASGKVSLELQTVVPAQLIEQVVSSLLPTAEAKRIRIDMDVQAALAPVSGDSQRLLQVFRNLLVNAIKFTPEGGVIRIGAELADQELILVVTDSGVGISADFLPHVFERFRQADPSATRSQGGLGLGLAIVQRLVELHRGSVEAASAGPGRGASFTVRLPVVVEEQAGTVLDVPPMVLTQEERPIHDVRVLLVEDDHDGREMVDQLLRDHGGTVTGVESAPQALAALRDGLFDVVVSDIGMPGMDGYELVRRIREGGNPIPAIALSAFAHAEDKAKALAAGYDSHLSKPVEPPALIAAVADVARSRR